MARIILVRHPQTSARPGLCYGRSDPVRGARSVHATHSVLKALHRPPVVFSSPSERCLTPARSLARRLRTRLCVQSDWRELDFGDWEGRMWADVDRALTDRWLEDPLHTAPPGGERFIDMLERVERRFAQTPDQSVVVTHAGVIRASWMLTENLSFWDAFSRPVPFATPLELQV